jgi:predicted RNA-binding Zn ribbon-like protein
VPLYRCKIRLVQTAAKSGGTQRGRESEHHRLIGGNVSLDFVNTLNGHGRLGGHEYLHDFRDLVLWSRHAGLLPSRTVDLIRRASLARPSAAAREFHRAIRLREALFRLFAAAARGLRPRAGDLQILNAAWLEGQQHARILMRGNWLSLGWDDDRSLRSISRSLGASAVALLTSPDLQRIRMCSGEKCDWLFLDTSRNHLRRWCSMDECGNRAKMRRRRLAGRLKAAA